MEATQEQLDQPTKPGALTLQELIQQGRVLRDRVKEHEEVISALKKEKEAIDQNILDIMEAQGISRTATDAASVSVTLRKTPLARDWDLIYKYILEKGYCHILQKRLSTKALEEIIDIEGPIEGIEIEDMPVLNFRRK